MLKSGAQTLREDYAQSCQECAQPYGKSPMFLQFLTFRHILLFSHSGTFSLFRAERWNTLFHLFPGSEKHTGGERRILNPRPWPPDSSTFLTVLCPFLLPFAHHVRALCASWESSLRIMESSLRLMVALCASWWPSAPHNWHDAQECTTGMTHKSVLLA